MFAFSKIILKNDPSLLKTRILITKYYILLQNFSIALQSVYSSVLSGDDSQTRIIEFDKPHTIEEKSQSEELMKGRRTEES